MYEAPLQRMLEAVDQLGEGICKGLDPVIFYAPYNSGQMAKLFKLEHDWLSLQDLKNVVKFLSALMKMSTPWHMYCWQLQ